LPQGTQVSHIATRRALGVSIVPGINILRAVPLLSVWPFLGPFPSGLGLCKLSAPSFPSLLFHAIQRRGKSPFLPQVPIRAKKKGVGGEGWAGQGQNWRRELSQEDVNLYKMMRGMKGYPQLPDHTHLSPSCRVSHGIAGTFLGEMALCAKKRPPGKKARSVGSPEPLKVDVIMA
jgi:hypothetical protein